MPIVIPRDVGFQMGMEYVITFLKAIINVTSRQIMNYISVRVLDKHYLLNTGIIHIS